ncbi:glycosyltransferase family 2 protein, partial [Campylobacter avium]|uniref:glycosyltransferase family 2 protein n=2 Tax=Campylobacter avium TaxID=522485 RepID=UPI002353F898
MQNPKISVLIPSYNSIKYINEALQSAVNQTFKDIEIICIDANSNDGTLEFLKEEQRKDERIRIILSDKKSLGYQLNLGFKEAKGEYLTIIESDDYARLDMCEKLYELALKYGSDITQADCIKFTKRKKNICPALSDDKFYNKLLDDKYKNYLIKNLVGRYHARLYKLDFIKKFNLKVNESNGASYQDVGFFLIVIVFAKTVYIHRESLYFYRQDNEASSTNNKEKVYCICDEYEYAYNILSKDEKFMNTFFSAFMYKKFGNYWWNLKRIDDKFKLDFIKR